LLYTFTLPDCSFAFTFVAFGLVYGCHVWLRLLPRLRLPLVTFVYVVFVRWLVSLFVTLVPYRYVGVDLRLRLHVTFTLLITFHCVPVPRLLTFVGLFVRSCSGTFGCSFHCCWFFVVRSFVGSTFIAVWFVVRSLILLVVVAVVALRYVVVPCVSLPFTLLLLFVTIYFTLLFTVILLGCSVLGFWFGCSDLFTLLRYVRCFVTFVCSGPLLLRLLFTF